MDVLTAGGGGCEVVYRDSTPSENAKTRTVRNVNHRIDDDLSRSYAVVITPLAPEKCSRLRATAERSSLVFKDQACFRNGRRKGVGVK